MMSTNPAPVADAPNVVFDMLIIGGGPAGTAAAFRAKELGLKTLLIDFDDILKRIRDYPKDKLILPDFGGGDRMAFPAGDECVSALRFEPIDKDEICRRWRGHYATFGIDARTRIELTGVERDGDIWNVKTWDHKAAEAATFRARHVVLAIGRGVPRRFDIPGNTEGIAYRLDDPARYVDGPVLVVGGGTSAAEAVLAISNAKIAADESCAVYWAYRGTKMPMVSKALAERFFEAYIGNGNIRSLPDSEPVSIVTNEDRTELLSLRSDRRSAPGRPTETVHLEFPKTSCIACIGEDIPEALLGQLGISLIPGGPTGKKMLVTPLLETEQPNIYLIGDLLSQTYLETDDFNSPPETHRQVKHRGNIKTSLRDGVFVAEVIRQRIDGKANVVVTIQDAAPLEPAEKDSRIGAVLGLAGEAGELSTESPADTPEPSAHGYLVTVEATGVEGEEFRLNADGITTIGRGATDIQFAQDTFLSESHASLSFRDGAYYLRDDGSQSGTYLRVRPDKPMRVRDGDLFRAGRQILLVSHSVRGSAPTIEHYDAVGKQVGSYPINGTVVFGRTGGRSDPDVILDDKDTTLSRFHLSVAFENDELQLQDFASRNGTFVKIDTERMLEHRDIIRIGGQQLELRMREDLPEKTSSLPVAAVADVVESALAVPAPPAPPAPEPAAAAPIAAVEPIAAVAAAPAGPHLTFAKQNIEGPIDSAQTLLAWADEKEVSIDYECWIGMCGCDAIRIISGAEHLNELTEKEIKTLKRKGLEPGLCRLACMTRTSGPVVVEVVE